MALPMATFAAGPYTPSDTGMINVDATVMHDATPDIINFNVSCEVQSPMSRAEVRSRAKEMLQAIRGIVGNDGDARMGSSPMVYPFYREMPMDPSMSADTKMMPPMFTGTMNFFVRNVKIDAAQRISDAIEDSGCGVNWDIRIVKTAKYARQLRSELMAQIDEKKAVFEDILGTSITKISNMSTYTSIDYGYGSGSFDADTKTVQAMTTLNVTFDLGTKSVQPK